MRLHQRPPSEKKLEQTGWQSGAGRGRAGPPRSFGSCAGCPGAPLGPPPLPPEPGDPGLGVPGARELVRLSPGAAAERQLHSLSVLSPQS